MVDETVYVLQENSLFCHYNEGVSINVIKHSDVHLCSSLRVNLQDRLFSLRFEGYL